ncbi:MAG: cell division suppressor protein YneA [Clostridia bacterium]|jgi:LysM repeat protein
MRKIHRTVNARRIRIRSKARFIIFLTFLLLAAFALYLSLYRPTKAQSSKHIEYHQVYIEEGDTLWHLAREYVPERMDIRKFIEIVKEQNSLSSGEIRPGQVIRFPKY